MLLKSVDSENNSLSQVQMRINSVLCMLNCKTKCGNYEKNGIFAIKQGSMARLSSLQHCIWLLLRSLSFVRLNRTYLFVRF